MSSAAADFKGRVVALTPQNTTEILPGSLYNDPRTFSTESLTPSLPPYEEVERRKLLVVYVHGFMGNDTSFQSFPAHVHRYLKLALSDTHVVHSKIYPRYKTYKSIDVARDNFSQWLEPLENIKTDIVLVGHSMGGLLAADVVLMRPMYQPHGMHHNYFKHRILGVVNLDCPLLGMHPGIIVSGISSLFRKDEMPKVPGEPPTQPMLSPGTAELPSPNLSTYSVPSTASQMSPSPPPPPAPFVRPTLTHDSTFNPNFVNDVRIKERTWWKNVVHFVKKHNSEGLIDAAANHIMSHLEFGGSMFDFNSLKTRYDSIRKLEDVDDLKQVGLTHAPPQVRFIQYYTICNGFPKKPKDEDPEQDDTQSPSIHDPPEERSLSPHISVDDRSARPQSDVFKQDHEPLSLPNSQRSSLELLSPEPILDELPLPTGGNLVEIGHATDTKPPDDNLKTVQATNHETITSPTDEDPTEDKTSIANITHDIASLELDLPALPEMPQKPNPLNLEDYADKDARKLAEKEAKRVQKVYAQAVKDREKAIKDREKIIEKRRKKLAQEAEKKAKEEKKRRKKEEGAVAVTPTITAEPSTEPTEPKAPYSIENQEVDEKLSASGDRVSPLPPPELTPVSPNLAAEGTNVENKKSKEKSKGKGKEEKPKRRKFCNVPKSHGQVDPKWVGVFMKDMDEVAAHTSLFFAGEHYGSLVSDVGDTIVEWVHTDMTKRVILELQ